MGGFMFCNDCGYKNPENARFCSKCGFKLTTEHSEETAVKPLSDDFMSLTLSLSEYLKVTSNRDVSKFSRSLEKHEPSSLKMDIIGLLLKPIPDGWDEDDIQFIKQLQSVSTEKYTKSSINAFRPGSEAGLLGVFYVANNEKGITQSDETSWGNRGYCFFLTDYVLLINEFAASMAWKESSDCYLINKQLISSIDVRYHTVFTTGWSSAKANHSVAFTINLKDGRSFTRFLVLGIGEKESNQNSYKQVALLVFLRWLVRADINPAKLRIVNGTASDATIKVGFMTGFVREV